jgi:hypothetical protein
MREHRGRWWPWLVLAGVGITAVSWRWLAPAATTYLGADLDNKDKYSSVYSLAVGVMSLLVAVAGLWRQWRSEPPAGPVTTPGPATSPGMISLDVPQSSMVDQIRGRDVLTRQLVRACRRGIRRSSRVHVLHGMGGAGKTTTAIHVAIQAARKGITVWWVTAAQETDLNRRLWLLAQTLGAAQQELHQDWAEHAPDVLWNRLNAYPGRWLLVIDNADDLALLTAAGDTVADRRGWIRPPGTRSGTLLVTSRDSNHAAWGGWCHLHSVGMLADTEGARILTDLAGLAAGPPEQAERLSARLGGLPLALTLAGHYLADAGRLRLPGAISTYTDYQQALDRSGLTAVFPTPAAGSSALTGPQARAVITRTWELSLPLLERRGLGPAVTLLRLLSLFAAAPIPLKVLDPDAIAASPAFPHADAILIRAWLDGLATLNLITLNTDSQESPATLHLHPLIRDASRHHLPAEQSSALYGLAAHLINLTTTGRANRPGNHTAWPLWQLISPHPAALLADITARRAPDPEAVGHAADAALRVTEYLAAISRYDTALTQARTILETCLTVLPAEHPTTLEAREDLANWTGLAGDPEAARDQYAALLPIRERVLGPEHPHTLTTLNNFAFYTGAAGDPVGARDQFAVLLPIRKRVQGPEYHETLNTQHNLAGWTGHAGDAAAARDHHAVLLPIRERVLGPEHPETLLSRESLAGWTGDAGDPAAARDQYAALLAIEERVFGPEHPKTLHARYELAAWTGDAGDPAAARDQYTALLPVYERVLGPEHSRIVDARSDLTFWEAEAARARAAPSKTVVSDMKRTR